MDWGEGEYDEQKRYKHEKIEKQDLCTEDEKEDENNEKKDCRYFCRNSRRCSGVKFGFAARRIEMKKRTIMEGVTRRVLSPPLPWIFRR